MACVRALELAAVSPPSLLTATSPSALTSAPLSSSETVLTTERGGSSPSSGDGSPSSVRSALRGEAPSPTATWRRWYEIPYKNMSIFAAPRAVSRADSEAGYKICSNVARARLSPPHLVRKYSANSRIGRAAGGWRRVRQLCLDKQVNFLLSER